jgi:hypothetical protein
MARSALLHPPDIPLTFRHEIVPHIFHAIGGGWSCALVGVKGVGMSNLLRFVCEPRVVAHYLGDATLSVLFVQVESDLRFEADRADEAIIRQIPKSARAFGWPRADVALLDDRARQLATAAGSSTAEDILAEMIAYVCKTKSGRVVLAFDEFDRVIAAASPALLRGLRRLRDNHKTGLSYLIGMRAEFGELIQRHHSGDPDAVKLAELFDEHTFAVQPYTHDDAIDLIGRKSFDWEQPPASEQQDQLYRATGGHAKLLVTGLSLLANRLHLPWPDIARGLRDNASVFQICYDIWNELNEGERTALQALAQDRRDSISDEDLKRLRLKGMVTGRPDHVFSSLFEAFILRGDRDLPHSSRLHDPGARVDW